MVSTSRSDSACHVQQLLHHGSVVELEKVLPGRCTEHEYKPRELVCRSHVLLEHPVRKSTTRCGTRMCNGVRTSKSSIGRVRSFEKRGNSGPRRIAQSALTIAPGKNPPMPKKTNIYEYLAVEEISDEADIAVATGTPDVTTSTNAVARPEAADHCLRRYTRRVDRVDEHVRPAGHGQAVGSPDSLWPSRWCTSPLPFRSRSAFHPFATYGSRRTLIVRSGPCCSRSAWAMRPRSTKRPSVPKLP